MCTELVIFISTYLIKTSFVSSQINRGIIILLYSQVVERLYITTISFEGRFIIYYFAENIKADGLLQITYSWDACALSNIVAALDKNYSNVRFMYLTFLTLDLIVKTLFLLFKDRTNKHTVQCTCRRFKCTL